MKNRQQGKENEPRGGGETDRLNESNDFIMITQRIPLLFYIQMSALCSQDSDLQFDLTWDHM